MANGEAVTQYFQADPYNFDVPPSPYLIGPLKSIFTVIEARLQTLLADITALGGEFSVANAGGVYLDAHGALYGVGRLPYELDPPYRARIIASITIGKLTLAAIKSAVQGVLDAKMLPSDPQAVVYDLYSDPDMCAQDIANGQPIVRGNFVVGITTKVSVADEFFLDYTEIDDQAYLADDTGSLYAGGLVDPDVLAAVMRTKAGGAIAIFANTMIAVG